MIYKDTSKIIMPAFQDAWRAERHVYHNVKKGGRNTGKSIQTAVRFVFNRMKTKTSGLVVRRYFNTLRDSVFVDLITAIYMLGVQNYWKWSQGKTGALSMVYLPTGTEIYFRGADRPDRIKGIKSIWPISDCWFEELAEFRSEEDLNTIIFSIYRADIGENYTFFYSYNPPKKKGHWANKKFNTTKPLEDYFIHHSTIYDNIHISQQMLKEAEKIKIEKPLQFEWMFMGAAIGGGVIPFSKLTPRTITNTEIESFDNIRIGLDWGYANNILAVIKFHLDMTRRKLYFMDEIQGLQVSNKRLIEQIYKKGFDKHLILCDSASPKDITDLKNAGLDALAAKKGPGSVEYGERWLNDFEIIYDWDRTPKAAQQFEDIDYDVDVHGNILDRLIDFDNDFIDAVRYGAERDMHGGAKIY